MKKEDLEIGKIYYWSYLSRHTFLNKIEELKPYIKVKYLYINSFFSSFSEGIAGFNESVREATPEEIHWFECCEKTNKFISREEAMKSFKPQFVLPKYWWVEIENEEQLKVYKDYFSGKIYAKLHVGINLGYIKSDVCGIGYIRNLIPRSKQNNTKITFEQFKKHVLKEEEQPYKILKQEGDKILQVQNSEGSIFDIGDIITPTIIDSANRGRAFKITGFRWNNAKDTLCAVTKTHSNGISIDKIEHYIEVDTFVLPEKWCVKADK